MAKEEPKVETTEEPVDEIAEQLAKAAALMQKAATERVDRGTVLKELESVLSKIPITALPEMEESPIVQAFVKAMGVGDLNPGEVKNRNTAAERSRDWSINDLGQFKQVQFTPNENLPLTWNGITAHVQADMEVVLPEPFYNIYRDYKKAKRQAGIADAYRMGVSDVLPDPMYLDADSGGAEAATVRFWSIQGRPYGRPGGTLTTGLIITDGGRDA